MYNIKIKASAINNLTDARYFAAWGVDYLGFELGHTGVSLMPEQIKEIKDWVEGPTFVGEFSGMQSIDEIISVLEETGLEGIQLGPFGQWNERLKHYEVFREVLPGEPQEDRKYCDFVVLNEDRGFLQWTETEKLWAKTLCRDNKTFLNIPFLSDSIESVLEELQPYGIVLKGSTEEKTGFKSFDDLDVIFEVLETQL